MINQSYVQDFYRHYHESVVKRPDLYKNGDTMITVVLPSTLLEYSNAAAGHSGFGSGARAVGIRRQVRDSSKALADIFESVESLTKFIETSECDGPAYVEQVRLRHAERSIPKPVMASSQDGFWSKYNKDTMTEIKAHNKDHKQLVEDYKTLTLLDFEIKYKLVDKELA